MATKIGLDFGYANIAISDSNAGVYREQSVALIDKDSRRIVSVGNSAVDKSDEMSETAVLVRPFKNGLLFDKQITMGVISQVTKELPKDDNIRCVIGVPSDLISKQDRKRHNV